MKLRSAMLALGLVAITAGLASAHPHPGAAAGASGLSAGFFHPLLGLDHLLAMFAVGLLAAQLGGRAIWLLPAAFLGLMTLGGALGMTGYAFQLNEIGIALSVVALGLAIAAGRKYPLVASTIVVGLFGLIHGHAHGTEIPALAAGATYAAGFLATTAGLHAAGIGLGLVVLKQSNYATAIRIAGGAISLAGLVILARAF
jgi:urease accessory protein